MRLTDKQRRAMFMRLNRASALPYYRAVKRKYYPDLKVGNSVELTLDYTSTEPLDEAGNLILHKTRTPQQALSFSKSVEGALLGALTNNKEGGDFLILKTEQEPNIDLSNRRNIDFKVLEEVRYYRPIPATMIGEHQLDEHLGHSTLDAFKGLVRARHVSKKLKTDPLKRMREIKKTIKTDLERTQQRTSL
jgi:hypothetical protein